MGLGAIMGTLTLLGSFTLVILAMLIGGLLIGWKGYNIARETVELEDLSEPAEGIVTPMERVDVKPYLLFQLALIASYIVLLALSWGRMPGKVATHFNFYGNPDKFEPKSSRFFLMPLVVSTFIPFLTCLGRDPMAFRIAGSNIKAVRIILEFLTINQFLVWGAFLYVLLYNAYNFSSPAVLGTVTIGSIILMIVEMARLVRR